jgi:hypothetical protein
MFLIIAAIAARFWVGVDSVLVSETVLLGAFIAAVRNNAAMLVVTKKIFMIDLGYVYVGSF